MIHKCCICGRDYELGGRTIKSRDFCSASCRKIFELRVMAVIVQDLMELRKVSRNTTIEECDSLNLFKQLEITLKESPREGAGLHCVQIGYELHACIIRIPEIEKLKQHEINVNMINPKILSFSTPVIMPQEGCLSLPGVTMDTIRYLDIVVEWLDYDEKKIKKAAFHGFEAIVVQHEVDHGMGILFTDKQAPKQKIKAPVKDIKDLGRNDPCHCGSNKKYKKCCLAKDQANHKDVVHEDSFFKVVDNAVKEMHKRETGK